jgi:hypothetical protein
MGFETDSKENVNLLWTGGWDSTFQLLQLLIIHQRPVTPFYLMYEGANRRSTGEEIRAMKRIKEHLLKEYPHTQKLLQPTQYSTVANISPDSEITKALELIRKKYQIGTQYDWLARFCKENGLADMQLCLHRDDKARLVIEKIVRESTSGSQIVFRVDPKFEEMNEYVIFRYFSFPIFQLSKLQMSSFAKKQGWDKIMRMTWFCHKPTNKMKPCGKCGPCNYAIEEGLGLRIPLSSQTPRSLARIILVQLGLLKYIRYIWNGAMNRDR